MPRLTTTILIAAAAFFGTGTPASAQSLRTQLETAYGKWQTAMVTKSLSAWTEATAAPRRAATRNIIVSQRQPFPASLFAIPIAPPSIHHLRFLKAEEENGSAVAIYFGKVDFGVTDPGVGVPENILILRFMKDGGLWKFDRTRFINLAPTPDVREKIAGGDRFVLANPIFKPFGSVPPVPAAFPMPAYTAHLEVVAAGYEATVRINEHHETTLADDSANDLVIGGLAEGRNALTVETRPLDGAAERKLEISVYVIHDDRRKPPVRIYHFAPEKETDVPEKHTATVYANAVTIRD